MNMERLLNSKRVSVSVLDTSRVNGLTMRLYRFSKGWSASSLAVMLGVSKKTILKWENGEVKINGSAKMLFALMVEDESIIEKIYKVEVIEGEKL